MTSRINIYNLARLPRYHSQWQCFWNKQKAGFTFIEMMIAISVFSIGIIVVLQLIIKNLTVVDTAKLRTAGTLIAKEWIELVYNMRDANLDKWLEWNCVFDNELFNTAQENLKIGQWICDSYFASGRGNNQVLQLSYDTNQYIYRKRVNKDKTFLENFEKNKLYISSGSFGSEEKKFTLNLYSHTSPNKIEDNIPLFYARYIVLKPITENDKQLPTDKILKVESHVLMKKWWYTGEVILESFIGNY